MSKAWNHEKRNRKKRSDKQRALDGENHLTHEFSTVAAPHKPFRNKTKTGLFLSRSHTTQNDVTLRAASSRKPKNKPSMPKMPWDNA